MKVKAQLQDVKPKEAKIMRRILDIPQPIAIVGSHTELTVFLAIWITEENGKFYLNLGPKTDKEI